MRTTYELKSAICPKLSMFLHRYLRHVISTPALNKFTSRLDERVTQSTDSPLGLAWSASGCANPKDEYVQWHSSKVNQLLYTVLHLFVFDIYILLSTKVNTNNLVGVIRLSELPLAGLHPQRVSPII